MIKPSIKKTHFSIIAVASMMLVLTACDSTDSSSNGLLSVSVTDAPVDEADNVFVEFNGMEIKPANGDPITFDFTERCTNDPTSCQIDLLLLTGGASELILDGETVPSGQYSWLRLMVNAEQNVRDSYIVVNGKEYELRVPSGAESGLKLNRGFVVPAGGEASFTIDFDLRKSVHDPVGASDYILRPSLRMVDNTETGTLSGNVDPSFFASGTCKGAVYVFVDGTVDAPDDEDGEGFGPDPIASALVKDDGVHGYNVSFLSEGDYLIAFTCDALADIPDEDNDNTTVSFLSTATVTVSANSNKVYDFQP